MTKVYTGWESRLADDPKSGLSTIQLYDAEGNDWYDLMLELDVRKEPYVVCTQPYSERIMWVAGGPVSGRYAPMQGSTVFLADKLPAEQDQSLWRYTDGILSVAEPEKPVERTKSDILADLERLRAELESMKE